MEVKLVSIHDLKPAEYNPRQMKDNEFQQIKESIEKYGFVTPIVLNKNTKRKNVIIGGHQRVEVARFLGIYKVPAVFVDIGDIKVEQELNLRLNKNTGSWDVDRLANFDEELLKKVGWRDDEVEKMFDLRPDVYKPPELEFTQELMFENNYVVFKFNNKLDWNVIVDKLGIKSVKSLDSK